MEILTNYTIAYRGFKLFDGDVNKLVDLFEIKFVDEREGYDPYWRSERFQISDTGNLQDFIETILYKINHFQSELSFHDETMCEINNDCETKEDFEELRSNLLNGDFETWSSLYFCYRAVDTFYRDNHQFDLFDVSSTMPKNYDWGTYKWIGEREYV